MSEPLVGNFVKLYGSIVTSSVWSESAPTRIVWLTMLAIADANGGVAGSVPGLARIANVTVTECEAAIKVLSEPDPYSKTPDHEGRRITAVNGGWMVLNYKLYREMRTAKQVADAERQARHRAAGQGVTVTEVTAEEEGEVEVDRDLKASSPSLADGLVPEVARLALRQVLGTAKNPTKAAYEIKAYADGLRAPLLPTPDQLGRAVLDFAANGPEWNSGYFRSYVKRAIGEDAPKPARKAAAGDDADFVRASEKLQALVDKRDPLHSHTLTPDGWALLDAKERASLKVIGGIERVLTAKSNEWQWVVRDFLKAQRGAAA